MSDSLRILEHKTRGLRHPCRGVFVVAMCVGALTGCGAAVSTDGGDAGATTDAVAERVLGGNCSEDPGDGAAFPVFDRRCSTDSDCAVGSHVASCCGNLEYDGFTAVCTDAYTGAAMAWNSAHPAVCDCVAGSRTSSGVPVALPPLPPNPSIVPRCASGTCVAAVETICNGTTCAAGQVCLASNCGLVPACVSITEACVAQTDCSCVTSVCDGCSGSVSLGRLNCPCGM